MLYEGYSMGITQVICTDATVQNNLIDRLVMRGITYTSYQDEYRPEQTWFDINARIFLGELIDLVK